MVIMDALLFDLDFSVFLDPQGLPFVALFLHHPLDALLNRPMIALLGLPVEKNDIPKYP